MPLFPIEVNGTRIKVPNMGDREGYFAFRSAILDGHVPIYMPVGFKLNSPSAPSSSSAIGRAPCCQESMVAIATNASNIVFTGDLGAEVDMDEMTGVVTTGNANWRSQGRYKCEPVNKNQQLLTAVKGTAIVFKLRKAAGFHSVSDNAKFLDNTSWFPLNTNHTLVDYVRVLPFTGDGINVRYINGMTSELFAQIWNEGGDWNAAEN